MEKQKNQLAPHLSFAAELLGNSWSVILLRDVMVYGKHTFSEFAQSPEGIVPSVLTEQLSRLVEKGILRREKDSADGRKVIYNITEQGISLTPVLYEMIKWEALSQKDNLVASELYRPFWIDRQLVLDAWDSALRKGDSFFQGSQSAVQLLGVKKKGSS